MRPKARQARPCFSLYPECTSEFTKFTRLPVPAARNRKRTPDELLISHPDCISVTSFIETYLFRPEKKPEARGCLHSCPQIHPLLQPCPPLSLLLFVAPPFPSSPLPTSANNVNSSLVAAYFCIFSPTPACIQFHLKYQIRLLAAVPTRGFNRATEPFLPRQGRALPKGRMPGLC